jgi:hypothetical protein
LQSRGEQTLDGGTREQGFEASCGRAILSRSRFFEVNVTRGGTGGGGRSGASRIRLSQVSRGRKKVGNNVVEAPAPARYELYTLKQRVVCAASMSCSAACVPIRRINHGCSHSSCGGLGQVHQLHVEQISLEEPRLNRQTMAVHTWQL